MASERTGLYRLFAADDTVLYVGVAKRFGRRWEQHAKARPWWPHVDHQTVYWYPAREDALLAEKAAIEAERPVYNIAGSPWVGGVKDDGSGFYVIPKAARPKTPRDRSGETPAVQLRVPRRMWAAYGRVCARLGRDRTEDLIRHIRAQVRKHGDEQDLADLATAEAELAERRARRGGRPPKTA